MANRRDMSDFRAIVLVAVDDSEHSEYAFNWYRDYIHRPEFYTVLVHCVDIHDQDMLQASFNHDDGLSGSPSGVYNAELLIQFSSPGQTAKMVRELTEEMNKIEAKFGQLMDRNGIKGRIRRGSGRPGEAIVTAAQEEGATMIVTGTRGHGKIKRAFLGSVSDYVVHHAKCPVITCKHHN